MSYKPVILNYKAKEMFDEIFKEVKQIYALLDVEYKGGNIGTVYSEDGSVVYYFQFLDSLHKIFVDELSNIVQEITKYFLELRD